MDSLADILATALWSEELATTRRSTRLALKSAFDVAVKEHRETDEIVLSVIGRMWKSAFDQYDQLLRFEHLVHSLAVSELLEHLGSDGESDAAYYAYAQLRLSRRANLTAEEILILSRAGCHSGAVARLRTLYETWLVMAFMAKFKTDGDDIWAHATTSTQASQVGSRFWADYDSERLRFLGGFAPEDRDETFLALLTECEATVEKNKEKFGDNIGRPFGWALPYLPAGVRPGYTSIEAAVDSLEIPQLYRVASWSVHPSAQNLLAEVTSGEAGEQLPAKSSGEVATPLWISAVLLANTSQLLAAECRSDVVQEGAEVVVALATALADTVIEIDSDTGATVPRQTS